jgi:carbonic anhydrase/acetyltransferase-like protein (isoleucine patch superfamily)
MVADDVLIGMRAVVMNRAKIASQTIIGVGAVVTEDMEVPPGSVVMGVPGRVRRGVEPRDLERIRHAASHYVELSRRITVARTTSA